MNRDDGLFSFYLSTGENTKSVYKNHINFGRYCLSYSTKTNISQAIEEEAELVILGDAVNLQTGESVSLASSLLGNVSDIHSLIKNEYYIGGKYVIFYRRNNEYFVMGDATCSVPINYTCSQGSGFICASNLWDIATRSSYEKDEYMLRIRNSSDVSQAMPYDYTVYKEIKQLLPNHYLEATMETTSAHRFVIQCEPQSNLSPKEAAKKTAPWITKLAEFYLRKYDVCCPITAGRDSRVVLAFLRNQNKSVPCYTMKHKSHLGDEQDLTVPVELCKKAGLPHTQIEDVNPSEEMIKEADSILGTGMYAQQTLKIANTVQDFCQGRAIINGDIIGQVGKCSLHRDIPQVFASPSYFMCKLHNYSKGAKTALKEWLKKIKQSEEFVSSFDLFSIENRMGRWAAQESLIYNTIGQCYLNIFNSRCIIYAWTRVPRKDRKTSKIHIELIKLIDESLLDVAFEFDKSIAVRISKSTGMAYYCASFLKYWIQGFKFKKRKENKQL